MAKLQIKSKKLSHFNEFFTSWSNLFHISAVFIPNRCIPLNRYTSYSIICTKELRKSSPIQNACF